LQVGISQDEAPVSADLSQTMIILSEQVSLVAGGI